MKAASRTKADRKKQYLVTATSDSSFQRCDVDRAALLIDARMYFRAFVHAAKRAKRSILLSGWQFDTEAVLVRGEDVETDCSPHFLPFLNELCERNLDLHVHVVAWDYSAVYALEREWFQDLKTTFRSHERLHFHYWTHPNPGGAHHHKYAIIDDEVVFIGGIDICDGRWDDRGHPPVDPERVDVEGRAYKPFHDIQLALQGPVASQVRHIFSSFYEEASGQRFDPLLSEDRTGGSQPMESGGIDFDEMTQGGFPLRTNQVALSRTIYKDEQSSVAGIEELFKRAISSAERFIYVENQYFTSRAMLSALVDRMTDESKALLDLVFVMPDGADSPKEDFVLGDRQRTVRYAVGRVAEEKGHRVRFLYSSDRSDPERPVSTFVHAKLMIVDDGFLTVGSANLTNRSMRIDSELNASVGGRLPSGEKLSSDIRAIRASLLAEHAGIDDARRFSDPATLVAVIDQCAGDLDSKLRLMDVPKPNESDPLLIALFDPSGRLSMDTLGEALEAEIEENTGFVRQTFKKLGQRWGVFDTD